VAADLLLAFGTAALLPCDEVVEVDPRHPACHPGFQLQVTVDDGIIRSADPRIGLMHRSAEKLFESRDLRQAMLLADRHDWLCSFTSEVTVALAAEDLLGIVPPERATWIRMLLLEVERISALLAFLAPVAGAMREEMEQARARLVEIQEAISGVRMHPGFARLGGVASWIVDDDRAHLRTEMALLHGALPAWSPAIYEHAERTAGLAVLSREQVVGLGVTGPVGRASGLDADLRCDAPYLAYAAVNSLIDPPSRTAGDAAARTLALLDQLPIAAYLAVAALDALDELGTGPIDVPLPKVVRLPEGMAYAAVEGPLGVSGALLAGDGDKHPLRLKIRSASFATLQALGPALVGTPLDRLADALMSFPVVMGDADR